MRFEQWFKIYDLQMFVKLFRKTSIRLKIRNAVLNVTENVMRLASKGSSDAHFPQVDMIL